MRPTLVLDLGLGGKGKVAIDGLEIAFVTAVRLEARVGAPTRASIDFQPATTVMRIRGVELSRETIEGLEAICAAWRYEHDELPHPAINYYPAVAERFFTLLHEAAEGEGRMMVSFSQGLVTVAHTTSNTAMTDTGTGGDLETALDMLGERRRP